MVVAGFGYVTREEEEEEEEGREWCEERKEGV